MSPSDGMENTSEQGEAQKMPLAVRGKPDLLSQANKHGTFPRYMDLPFKIRKQIRAEAIADVRGNFRDGDRPEQPCFLLALVSKEWKEDVEEVLFGEIQIDTLDDEEVSKFMDLFSTDRRKRFLTRLDIAIDDTEETGPWHQKMGIVQIAQLMGKIGQFLQYINGWNFRREDGTQQTIEIIFVTSHWKPPVHNANDDQLYLTTSSLWQQDDLNRITENGLIPADLPLKVIRSEFPSSLNMVKHLSLPPDILPLPAARSIIRTMPNLETCLLEPMFHRETEEPWRHLTRLIQQLRASAPSLRNLMLGNPMTPPRMSDWSLSMIEFAVVLRDYSQNLESLRVNPFNLDREFFLPFSTRILDVNPASTTWEHPWRWFKLKHLDLQFLDDESIEDDEDDESSDDSLDWKPEPYLPPEARPTRDGIRLSPMDILVAAGRTAWAMPILRSAHISVTSGHHFFLKRKLSHPRGGIPTSRFCLTGCAAWEEREIMSAWAHIMGPEPTLDPDLKYEFFDSALPSHSYWDEFDSDDDDH
ncbi:hypothetical protein F5883DRAFT_639902 [Diaporthe sp. PMI_573]|nr:hypothetical protein F5883DRAFT_639902 [Diaporthaceae sp. PMI_573]